MLFPEVGGEGVVAGAGHPAVALAQQADEERAAGADFVEAALEGFLAGALLLGDAPLSGVAPRFFKRAKTEAQVHLDPLDLPLPALAPQLGKNLADQQIPLFGEVTEGD